MQFHHPHAFRGQVVEALRAEAPEVLDALLAAGAEPAVLPDAPDRILGLRCRRMTFERVLRAAVVAEPGVTLHHGHAEEVLTERGRAAGLRVDGQHIEADLVLDASGRSGRLGRGLRAPEVGADCGIAYVSRQYALRPGAEPGPMQSPIASAAVYPGYLAIVFPHDNGVFSAMIGRSTQDRALVGLREQTAYERAAAAIPLLAEWTDPARAQPFTDVLPGGRLFNTYRGQLDAAGAVPVPGLVFVGDAVCTTNPAAGRGITTSLLQARRLIELVDEHGADHETTTLAFDAWCTEAIRPWFEDHVANDTDLSRRWAGGDVDLDRPLPSDLITAVALVDPSLMRVIGPYFGMQALPSSLRAIEPRAREIYAGGWRLPVPEGPDRAELVELVGGIAAA
jgi:flavin-dependent dehydrogenase